MSLQTNNLYDNISGLKLNLERIMHERNISQAKLADAIVAGIAALPDDHPMLLTADESRLSMSQTQLSLMIRGRSHLRIITLLGIICEVLQVDVCELLNENYERESWVRRMCSLPQDQLPTALQKRWSHIPFEDRMQWSINDIVNDLRMYWDENEGVVEAVEELFASPGN